MYMYEMSDSSPSLAQDTLQGQGLRTFFLFFKHQVSLHTYQVGKPGSRDRDNGRRGTGSEARQESVLGVSGQEQGELWRGLSHLLHIPSPGEARPDCQASRVHGCT